MQNPQPAKNQPPPQGLSLGDIYYVIFRRKRLILLFSAAGLLGALVFLLMWKPVYYSEAKILVRYVLESRSVTPLTSDSQIKSPDRQGDNIINSELEILTSLDLALDVADAVGPSKILASRGGGTNRHVAAVVVRKGLLVEVPKNSVIIRIRFEHGDPAIVQQVLSEVVTGYRKKHLEIHQGMGILDDFFARQADQIRLRLSQTEEDLNQLRTDTRVISLEETKRAKMSQIDNIQQQLLATEAELAERRSILDQLQRRVGKGSTNEPPAQDAALSDTEAPAQEVGGVGGVTPEIIARYRDLRASLEAFQNRKRDILAQVTEEHPQAKRLQAQITAAAKEKKDLETTHPELGAMGLQSTGTNMMAGDFPTEAVRVYGLIVKLKTLGEQLERTMADANKLLAAEPRMTQLQRKKELEEVAYRYYSQSLEQARVDESLGLGKITNISVVQAPSPAVRDQDEMWKALAGILVAGILGGLVLAFLLEQVFDQTIKRRVDVQRHVNIPLVLSIPNTSKNGRFKFLKRSRDGKTRKLKHPNDPVTPEVAPWDPQHPLHAHYEALRDRLTAYFESRNPTHKPKLVGITSCNRGAGVTSVALGLAASLSDVSDGKVLLVDMNENEGAAAFPFSQGKPGCGLSQAFELETPDTALIREKLYLVSVHETTNGELPRVMPKRFSHLIPKMKASDYDFIIFDMPHITQTSVTARLSGFMDLVVMVIESERTGAEIAKQAAHLLQESHANVTAVLNKHRAYVPERLRRDI